MQRPDDVIRTQRARLTKHWQDHYGIASVAYGLRTAFSNRWLRIYGLPGGKRYPEVEEEYRIVLARHNELLSNLIGGGHETVLITTDYASSGQSEPNQNSLITASNAWHWTSVRPEPDDPDAVTWHLYARVFPWRPGTLDTLLRYTAEDRVSNVIVLGIGQRIAYHPYDGGADIIARDEPHRELLKSRYKDWVSPRPDGL